MKHTKVSYGEAQATADALRDKGEHRAAEVVEALMRQAWVRIPVPWRTPR